MSPNVRKVLGESVAVLPVIKGSKPVEVWLCPHCNEQIHEKHTYVSEGIDYHSDCGKPIKFPAPDPATIPDWLKPWMKS